VTITLAQDDRLRFEVCEDGPGFSLDGAGGAGLTNVRDRISVLGGELEIVSGSGGGALVTGSVPLEP
jgi:signal transduction histidine kinase